MKYIYMYIFHRITLLLHLKKFSTNNRFAVDWRRCYTHVISVWWQRYHMKWPRSTFRWKFKTALAWDSWGECMYLYNLNRAFSTRCLLLSGQQQCWHMLVMTGAFWQNDSLEDWCGRQCPFAVVKWSIQSNAVITRSYFHCIIFNTMMTKREYKSNISPTKTPISLPHGRAMGCLLWELWENRPRYNWTLKQFDRNFQTPYQKKCACLLRPLPMPLCWNTLLVVKLLRFVFRLVPCRIPFLQISCNYLTNGRATGWYFQ